MASQDDYRVFVGGLTRGTTPDQLAAAFRRCGTVAEIEIAVDRETGWPRGFGFVTFTNPKSVNYAIRWMNNTELFGRTVSVKHAYPRTKNYGYAPHYNNNNYYDEPRNYGTGFSPYGNRSSHDQNYDYDPHYNNNYNETGNFCTGFNPYGKRNSSNGQNYNYNPHYDNNYNNTNNFCTRFSPYGKRPTSHETNYDHNPHSDNNYNSANSPSIEFYPKGNINKSCCKCNCNLCKINNITNSQADQGNHQKGKNVDNSSAKHEQTGGVQCLLCGGTGRLAINNPPPGETPDHQSESESEGFEANNNLPAGETPDLESESESEESSDDFEFGQFGAFYDSDDFPEYCVVCDSVGHSAEDEFCYDDYTKYCEICEDFGHSTVNCRDFRLSERHYFCECDVDVLKIGGHCLACGGLSPKKKKNPKNAKTGKGESTQNPKTDKKGSGESAQNPKSDKRGNRESTQNPKSGKKGKGESTQNPKSDKKGNGESSQNPTGRKKVSGPGKKTTGGKRRGEEPGNFMGLKLGFLVL